MGLETPELEDDSILGAQEETKENEKGTKRTNTKKSTARDDGSDSDGINAIEEGISGSELDDSGDLDSEDEFSEDDYDNGIHGDMDSEKSKSMANSAIMK